MREKGREGHEGHDESRRLEDHVPAARDSLEQEKTEGAGIAASALG
jgi:hypothetical protein